MYRGLGVLHFLKLLSLFTALAASTLPLAPDAEAAGKGSNGRDILFIPISWCVVGGSPAEANPNILGLDGILDNTTDAILWRRHERPTNAIFPVRCSASRSRERPRKSLTA